MQSYQLAALMLGMSAQAQAQEQMGLVIEPVIIQASRSNIEADRAPQTVVIIDRKAIEQQLAISGNSSDVLSSILPPTRPAAER